LKIAGADNRLEFSYRPIHLRLALVSAKIVEWPSRLARTKPSVGGEGQARTLAFAGLSSFQQTTTGPWGALKGKGDEKSWAHQEVNLSKAHTRRVAAVKWRRHT
jgi:hypothetical protein